MPARKKKTATMPAGTALRCRMTRQYLPKKSLMGPSRILAVDLLPKGSLERRLSAAAFFGQQPGRISWLPSRFDRFSHPNVRPTIPMNPDDPLYDVWKWVRSNLSEGRRPGPIDSQQLPFGRRRAERSHPKEGCSTTRCSEPARSTRMVGRPPLCTHPSAMATTMRTSGSSTTWRSIAPRTRRPLERAVRGPSSGRHRDCARVLDVLNVWCELKISHDLQAGEEFEGRLVIEPRAECVLVGLAPVETQSEEAYVVFEVKSKPGAERPLQERATIFGVTGSHEGHPFVVEGTLRDSSDDHERHGFRAPPVDPDRNALDG